MEFSDLERLWGQEFTNIQKYKNHPISPIKVYI